MKVLKQNVGIDLGKDNFVSSFVVLLSGQKVSYKQTREFKNTAEGIRKFEVWIDNLRIKELELHITMEATGVYYENFAYSLYSRQDLRLHVLLPNKAKNYIRSLNLKSKTDKIDAKILGLMGVERTLEDWVLSSKIYLDLKVLTREKLILIRERTMILNQLHAFSHSANTNRRSVTRCKNRINYINKQILSIEKDIKKLVESDKYISDKVQKIQTIPGISFSTIVGVIAETGGFINVKSIKQLSSYSGYDVAIKESGEWKGKSKISKRGNSNLRYYLHMPSLSAIQHSQTYKRIYKNIESRKDYKMIAVVAIQRKLLGLMYTLWKNDTEYIENYESTKAA